MNVEIKTKFRGRVLHNYFKDRSNVSIIRGALGSGKTMASIIKLLQLATEQEPNKDGIRPSRIVVIRNTYPDLTSTTIKDWRELTHDIAPVKMTHPPEQLLEWTLDDDTKVKCEVVFLALDREEDIRKLRGVQATHFYLNETKELPHAVIEMADGRLGRYPSVALGGVKCTKATIQGDTNSPDEDHWLANFESNVPEGWEIFVQPPAAIKVGNQWEVNPKAENISNLPDNYYKRLINGKRESWIKINVANEFGSSFDGKRIWDEFHEHIHVRDFDFIPGETILMGMDFGLTPACVYAQDINGTIYIFDETITDSMAATRFSQAVKLKLAQWKSTTDTEHSGWGDPAGIQRAQTDENTVFQVLQTAGLNIIPAPTNDFIIRRDAVGNRLLQNTIQGNPAIIIHPRCKMLRKSLAGGYCYKRIRTSLNEERYNDVPDKNMYSHIGESLQYLCCGLGDGLSVIGNDDWLNYEKLFDNQDTRHIC